MHIKKYPVLVIAMLPFFIGTGFLPGKKETPLTTFADNWTGSISFSYTIIDKRFTDGEIKTEFELVRNTEIFIDVKGNDKGHGFVVHSMKQREKIDAPFVKTRFITIQEAKENSTDEGDVAVYIERSYDNKTYYLKTDGPDYKVQRTSSYWTSRDGYAMGPPQTVTNDMPGIAIDVPDQPFGKNPNVISGSYIIFSSATHYVTVTWNLVNKGKPGGGINSNTGSSGGGGNSSSSGNSGSSTQGKSSQTGSSPNSSGSYPRPDAELIVTPEKYETWKPETDNTEKIAAELISKNQTSYKIDSIELKLFSTSRNGSISPEVTGNPDIRFLPSKNGRVSDDGQFIKIKSLDGIKGDVTIGSWHDLASTILVAEAILDNGRRIRGVLLQGGISEIPIPKQDQQVLNIEKQ